MDRDNNRPTKPSQDESGDLGFGRIRTQTGFLHPGPVERPHDWIARVNARMTAAEEESLRQSVQRGTPFGTPTWVTRVASRLGLESTLRPRGRPRKEAKK